MSGIINFFSKLFGNKYDKDIKQISPIVSEINVLFSELKNISNDELREKTLHFKEQIKTIIKEDLVQIEHLKKEAENKNTLNQKKQENYKKIDDLEKLIKTKIEDCLNKILPHAFAVMKETARRFSENKKIEVKANEHDILLSNGKDFVSIKEGKAIYKNNWQAAGIDITWDMVHYDVQLIGGIVLHQGKIAEMQTGEGKTLSATLPIYLNALTGLGVHLVTVNNYLAKRDAEWMGPLFQFHGLSVECIDNYQPNSEERKKHIKLI